ncbi:hypothetical protein G9C85_01045 [Halorubellus sp. JP-L1]|uniref:hypothetical protein n=1 Tax=Halorubellus sp. JP-L1 TaxID=2715753 RepID=UPI00140C27F8|nr:hypothetical protein [Halorubellus sp. JP-L1]NHN40222.1 hypothetical protein [Halorubellus sp. JP-L1]
MPEIRLELSPEDVRKLDTEVDLLGFEDRAAYLRWIIGNRAAIEQGTERDQLLTEYQSRVDELEAKLSAHDGEGDQRVADPADATGAVDAAGKAGTVETDRTRATDGSGATTATASQDGSHGGESTADADRPAATEQGANADRPAATEQEGTADRAAATEQSTLDASTDDRDEPESVAADAARGNSRAENDDLGGNFAPERVERFEDESLGSHANQLRGVEGERLDEFARRAVAKTRERLGREPSTGLDYRSGTRIARSSSDVRPGEDLVDLDSLDVPGRSESTCEPRREAVGAALAYLRDVSRAKRGDFVDELYDEYPAGYDSESGWWRCVKRGLKDAPVVDGGGEDSRVWRYRPPGSREGELVGGGPTRVVDPE